MLSEFLLLTFSGKFDPHMLQGAATYQFMALIPNVDERCVNLLWCPLTSACLLFLSDSSHFQELLTTLQEVLPGLVIVSFQFNTGHSYNDSNIGTV